MTPNTGPMIAAPGWNATSRQEFIADISLPTLNAQYMLPTNGGLIPNDRFMYGLWLIFEGRVTNALGAGTTGIQADAPFSLIESINVSGYHRLRGQNEPFIQIRGADLYNLNRIYNNAPGYVEPSSGWPSFVPSLSIIDGDTNDIRFALYLPFTPLEIPINAQMGYLLDAPNYDRLQLTVQFSDALSIFTGQTTQPAFTAYGSASGSPRLRVEGQFALGGASAFKFVPARVWRYFAENTTGDILAAVTQSRQYNVPRGNSVRGILIKTGVKAVSGTTVTAGNNVYNTYSDDIFTNIYLQRGLNKQIRRYSSQRSMKFEVQQAYGMYAQNGYTLMDFCLRQRLAEALNTAGLVAGPSGDTDVYVQADVAGAANTAAMFLIEELRGIPRRLA